MVFIWGLLAFFQMAFVPGFILLKQGRFDTAVLDGKLSKIQKLVYGFGLSLLINYLLVFLFTALRIYKPLILYIVLSIEAVLIWRIIKKSPAKHCLHINIKKIAASFQNFINSNSLVYNFLLILSAVVILYYILLFFNSIGTTFVRWDPVVSWNRFALDWANNQLPTLTWHYPQLIPANWSVSYVMMQNSAVQLFAKAIMPLFSIGILLLFLDLGLRKKNGFYLLSAILYGILMVVIYQHQFIVGGNVDIAVSFFAFLSFHVMHSRRSGTGSRDFNRIVLAVIFAAAAAVTKQAGLYILVVILVWACRDLLKNRKALSIKKIAGRFLLLFLVVIIITGSWYTLKEIQIQSGTGSSEIRMVQESHPKSSYKERLYYGASLLFKCINSPLPFCIFFLLVLLGLFHKQSRVVTIFIVIPYTLVWGFFFSYDLRNLVFAAAFMAFSAAFGIAALKNLLPDPKKIPQFKIHIIPVIFSVLLILTALNFTILKEETLERQQSRQKKELGSPGVNRLLYKYHGEQGIKGKIASRYTALKYLPGLGKFYREIPGLWFEQVTLRFFRYLKSQKGKDIHYILAHTNHLKKEKVNDFLKRQMKNKKYKLIFKYRGYLFVQVRGHKND